MRLAVPLTALALLIVLCWLALSGGGGSELPLPSVEPASPDVAQEPATGSEADLAEVITSEETVTVVRDTVAVEEDVPASVDDDRILVRGRLEHVDEAGVVSEVKDGTLRAILKKGSTYRTHEDVHVREGRFELRLKPEITELEFPSVTVSGESMVLVGEFEASYPVHPEQELVLRCRSRPEIRLLVRDATSRIDLTGVTVRRIDNWMITDMGHPGDPERFPLTAEGSSPLEFDPGWTASRSAVYMVHAPGWAWKRIEIDLHLGGEREVLLERGAIIDLEVLGERPDQGALRLRELGTKSRPYSEQPLPLEGRIRLEGVPAGDWTVSVELGEWFEEPLSLGQLDLALAGDEVVSGTIELLAVPDIQLAALSGTMRLPEEWQLEKPGLYLEPIESIPGGMGGRLRLELSRDGSDAELWHWDAGEVAVGRYELSLHSLYISTSFELGPGGRNDVHMLIPPPASILVRAVDESSRAVLPIASVSWSCKWPRWVTGGGLASVDAEPGEDSVTIRAPQTELNIRAEVEGFYQPTREPILVTSDLVEFEVLMARTYRLDVYLFDGEVRVPYEESWNVRVTCLSGKGRKISSGGAHHIRMEFDLPGRYQVEIPDIDGFEPISPFEVEFEFGSGGVTEEIALRRR